MTIFDDFDPPQAPTLQRRSWFLRAGDSVETKRAAHRFSAIRTRSLNDPRQCSLPTVQTVTLLSTPPRDTCTSGANRHIRPHPPANFDSCSMD
jgi:hypothetical protein